MLRFLAFLALVFVVGLGFAWLADRPGDMVVTFDGYQYQVTLMVAAAVLVAVIAAVMLTWWLVKSLWNSPYTIGRYFRVRRRDRGYQALSTGMIAAGAGDAATARKKKKEAMKLISADQEPLIHLLDAQASLLEGDHAGARAKFRAMAEDPETRLLGLRGLFLEAERLGERAAARHYAGQAADAAPQLAWAAEATLEERAEQGDWDGALRLIDAQRATRQVDKTWLNRRRAVLLTAKAMSIVEADPTAARHAALEAIKLEPDFVPATLAGARAAFRLDDLRKGAKLLETLWKKDAHPEIADLYVHARPGDSVRDRLKRAQKLQSLRNNNPVASLAVARAALQAGDFKLAREEGEAAIRLDPREGAFLLMADIEEAETGQQGKVREWLARALRAPRDPAWVADGYISERWAPLSPVTSRIDAFVWKVPVERTAQTIEQDDDRHPALMLAPAENEAVQEVPPREDEDAVLPAAPVTLEGPSVAEPPKEDAVIEAQPARPVADDLPRRQPLAARAGMQKGHEAEMLHLTRPPDDPGVDDDEALPDSGRQRLF